MSNDYFRFKQFTVRHDRCAMKVGTDGVLLGCLATPGSRILDIGTGTGLVAMSMAQRCPESTITAIDIDKDACEQAKENVSASPFAGRIKVIHSSLDIFCQTTNEKFDSIVCNPPFFADSLECPDTKRTAARHSSSLPYPLLANAIDLLLTSEGTCTIIIPTDLVEMFTDTCKEKDLGISKRLDIKTTERKKPKRTLLYICKEKFSETAVKTECLMENNQKSEWFRNTTQDFYI